MSCDVITGRAVPGKPMRRLPQWGGGPRVRNSANPCVRDKSKSLRTCQMSVHGYPVDMSIFCNLQLGLLKLQDDTSHADINQDNVPLAVVLQGAVGHAVDTPVFALLLDDNTRFSHDRRWDGACSRDASGRRFPNPSASRHDVHADFAAVEIGFYAQCWSCFSELDVGWSEPFLFIFNPKRTTGITHWS